MAERVAPASPEETGADRPDSASEEFDELRSLLIGPELNQVRRLQQRLDDPVQYARDVSRVLPDAVKLRTDRDDKLTRAIMPSVEEAISVSVKKNPQRLVDAIFPVMGPAIRKAISNAFSEMVQSLNKTLEYSISIKGLKWRLEALRSGKSFAEVVLSHTMRYKVEHVLLIHRETGLLLQKVPIESEGDQDPEMLSGLLTALQDFAHDSKWARESESLDEFKVGEFTGWLEQGPQAMLAAAVRGNAPRRFQDLLQDTLDAIQVEQRDAFEMFDGETEPFEACRPRLEACLETPIVEEEKKSSPFFWVLAAMVILAIGLWAFFYFRDAWRWDAYLAKLKSEPGIILISDEKRGGKHLVSGLRDPLAADPLALLNGTNVEPDKVVSRWEPFQASNPEFVLARASKLLQPPPTVTLKVEDGFLVAEGNAPEAWIAESRRLSQVLSSVYGYKDDNLIDRERITREINRLKEQIEGRAIQFAVGSAELPSDQEIELDALITDIKRLEAIVPSIGKSLRINTTGNTDKSGPDAINQRLSQDRAQALTSALSSKGIDTNNVDDGNDGATSSEPQNRRYGREARVKVVLADRPDGSR